MMPFTIGNRVVYKVRIFYIANKRYFVTGFKFFDSSEALIFESGDFNNTCKEYLISEDERIIGFSCI